MISSFCQLSGESTQVDKLPEACPHCHSKKFYKQADFKRSIGVSLVFIASVLSCILFYFRLNWFLVWSPMFLALILDRLFAKLSQNVAICYNCEHIYRGLSEEELAPLESFDLEIYDRFKYKNEHSEN